jgi:signal transduction histidine kinase
LVQWGVLGADDFDAAKSPRWITLPPGLLSRTQPTLLEVTVTTQANRWGGLSLVSFGPAAALYPRFQTDYFWRQTASEAIVIGLGLFGLLALALWWPQRDPLFGLFAATALFGMVRMADRIWPNPPLAWPAWGAVTAVAFALHLLLIVVFSLEATGQSSAASRRAFAGLGLACAVTAVLAFVLRQPLLWTGTLAVLALPGGYGLYQVMRQTRHTDPHTRQYAQWLSVAGLIVVCAGVRDFVEVRLQPVGGTAFSILPHAEFVYVAFMGWVITLRYADQVQRYRALNTTLEQRVADREAELHLTYEKLQHERQAQAVLNERQRIMRDIHDGVGAHLVGLLNMVSKGATAAPQAIEEQVKSALDELRMAVDAMQPVEGDLTTVLATLRYRLQPRLKAGGIEVLWEVASLPALPDLSPQNVLQIQRLLLEGFTNILKHAQATQVRVITQHNVDTHQIELIVHDNGQSFDPLAAEVKGHGLHNMRTRALAIGAQLHLSSHPGQGTRLVLLIPIKPPQ